MGISLLQLISSLQANVWLSVFILSKFDLTSLLSFSQSVFVLYGYSF